MYQQEKVLDVACDESGNNGENVTSSPGTVFAEGSHDLSVDESDAVMDWLRGETKSQAPEIKWKQVREQGPQLREQLMERLAGRSHIYLVEKDFYVVGKVVDLLVEELSHHQGKDLYANGKARKMAQRLYREGARAIGQEKWAALLVDFNSLMRIRFAKKATEMEAAAAIQQFFAHAEKARWASTRRQVTEVLALVVEAQPFAEEHVAALMRRGGAKGMPTLDPWVAAVAETARFWYSRTGIPVRLIHDNAPLVKDRVIVEQIMHGLGRPGEFAFVAAPVKLADIVGVDSRRDSRVQVADLLAGFGADIADDLLRRDVLETDLHALQPVISSNSLWGDDHSWKQIFPK